MATAMTPAESARRTGTILAALEAAIEETRNDAITKDTMSRGALTSRNITPETEAFMLDYLRNAEA